jgi:uncharacterized protein YdiU (UPF0061 family)
LRFGSFQIADPIDQLTGRGGPSAGNYLIIKKLLDYTIEYHFPSLMQEFQILDDRYAAFFANVVERTARLVAQWQCVG